MHVPDEKDAGPGGGNTPVRHRDGDDDYGLPGLFADLYRGKDRRLVILVTVVTLLAVLAFWYAFIRCLTASGLAEIMKWGVFSLFLLIIVSSTKIWFWMRMESERIVRRLRHSAGLPAPGPGERDGEKTPPGTGSGKRFH